MKVEMTFETGDTDAFMRKSGEALSGAGWTVLKGGVEEIKAKTSVHAIFGDILVDRKKLIDWFVTVKKGQGRVQVEMDVPVYLDWDFAGKKITEKITGLFGGIK